MGQIQIKQNQTPIEIALGIDERGMTTAKKLYEFLEMDKSNYSKWYKTNILENQFADEHVDYEVFVPNDENPLGGRPTQDFKLTAAFAKKLSMTAKNQKGEQAREYFIKAEDKLKEVIINFDGLSPELRAIFAHDKKIQAVVEHINKTDSRLDKLEYDIPLYGCEAKELSDHVRWKGAVVLGGKKSNAYKDRSITTPLYQDIYDQLKREFGLFDESGRKKGYQWLKRRYLADAHEFIDCYVASKYLKEQIDNANAQLCLA